MDETTGFYLKRAAGLVIAVLLAWGVTSSSSGHAYPVGWIYIALFFLSGALTFIARGTYMWIAAVWLGAFLVVWFGPRPLPDNLLLGAIIVGLQYLSAVLTGGLLGQWLRYQLAKRRGLPLPLLPTANMILVSGLFLLLLPVLAFLLLAGASIENESLVTVLMFVPGQTPFLLPSLLAGVLCGYWVRQLAVEPDARNWALLLMILSIVLIVLALSLRFVFGYLEWHGLLPS
ncbi:MAG: hypothetical protein PVH51_01705 [Thiohalophilus sp.]|jgi:hypothetical protein